MIVLIHKKSDAKMPVSPQRGNKQIVKTLMDETWKRANVAVSWATKRQKTSFKSRTTPDWQLVLLQTDFPLNMPGYYISQRRHTKLTVVMYVITNTLMECHLLPVDVRKMDLNKCNGLIVWWKHKNKHLANTGWRSWCLPQKVTEQLRFTVWQHLISGYWASLPETGLTIRQRQSQNFLVTTFLFFGAS